MRKMFIITGNFIKYHWCGASLKKLSEHRSKQSPWVCPQQLFTELKEVRKVAQNIFNAYGYKLFALFGSGKLCSSKFPSISSVQSLSCVWLFVTPWTAACQASLSITNSWNLLKLMSTESVMPSSHLILCPPFSPLPSIFPSIKVFSNESVLRIRWPKYWSFSFNISPFNEYSGLISFRINWLDLLAVQGTLKCLLRHHSSKASILQCSTFFVVQLSHPYMTTGKTIALTRRTFVGKVMSLLLNMLSRLVITCLPRSKCLLISWLHSPSAVILEPKKIKSVTVSTISPKICHEVVGQTPWSLFSECWALSQLFHSPLYFHQELCL